MNKIVKDMQIDKLTLFKYVVVVKKKVMWMAVSLQYNNQKNWK